MPSQLQHSLSSWHLAVLFLTFFSTGTAQQTKLWINQIPAYSNLPVCAENPVSRIVRGMASGCGDGGRLTSFACFCTDSSSKFASIISTAVESKCVSGDGTNQALDVFASYCRLTVSTTGTAAATSAPSTASPTASSTPSPLSTTPSSSSSVSTPSTTPAPTAPATVAPLPTSTFTPSASASTAAKAAIGVCIPLAILGLAAAIFFYLRARRARAQSIQLPMADRPAPPSTANSSTPMTNPTTFGGASYANSTPPSYYGPGGKPGFVLSGQEEVRGQWMWNEEMGWGVGPQPRDGGMRLGEGEVGWGMGPQPRDGGMRAEEVEVEGRQIPVEMDDGKRRGTGEVV